MSAPYTAIIGMEIHVELKTKSKMFCSCKNDPDRDAPNTNVCPICLAHPGTLPVPNQTAIRWAISIARALNCQVSSQSKFDRKHYFYPDLPKGYQISQYDQPIGEHGHLELDWIGDSNHRDSARIGITRVHLEEDTAKLTHADESKHTLADFNRAGVPLVEIVSDPDIQSGVEAKWYCQELQKILRYLNVSDADMEKGHMRCEANISLQETGKFEIKNGAVKALAGYKLNSKVELKNINSFRAVEKAINFEIQRQTELLRQNKEWAQQTRGWNDATGTTVLQREKETSADYRYFPDPDIPPFSPPTIETADKINLPEMPINRRRRFHQEYGFSWADAHLLTADQYWADYTEDVMSELVDWLESLPKNKKVAKEILALQQKSLARLAGGWLTSKLVGAMSERKIDIRILKLKPENFAELLALFHNGRVSSTNAQKILNDMLDANVDIDPTHLMEEKGYGQIVDQDKLGAAIDEVIKNYPQQVAQFKAGKEPVLQFLKGMVMKATEGSADPRMTEELLRKKLR